MPGGSATSYSHPTEGCSPSWSTRAGASRSTRRCDSLLSAVQPPESLGSPTVMEQRDAAVATGLRARASHALRQRHNWAHLAKFCVVGAQGYVVTLVVYAAL